MAKQSKRKYPEQFVREAVKPVEEHSQVVVEVAPSVGGFTPVRVRVSAAGLGRSWRCPVRVSSWERRPRSANGCGPRPTPTQLNLESAGT